MNNTLQNIAQKNNLKIKQVVNLQGGDINEVFLMKGETDNYVIKLNDAHRFPKMFEAESQGLDLLRSTNSFRIPNVIAYGAEEDTSYLLLEYISKGSPSSGFWENFAQKLAILHKTTNETFGLAHDNYIGSLPQVNSTESLASEFYINQRLEPQLKLASEKGFNFSSLDRFFSNIYDEIPNESPSLIHGDLWNGNYLVSEKNKPVLLDPAVAYAPREMDIAMMNLFGGFPQEVYSIYNEQFQLVENWKERIPIWQLYYLLVHLNLFGSSYLSQVSVIIKQYL